MRIRLDKVLHEPFIWEQTVEVGVAELERPELVAVGPVEWQGTLERVPPGFLLNAQYRYEQTLTCPRCLEPFSQPVEGDVTLQILTGPERLPERPEEAKELSEEELSLLVVEGDILDTRPILVEQLQLNVPMRAICLDDCEGLCPRCGHNLNSGPCDCDGPPTDPRWAALEALRSGSDN